MPRKKKTKRWLVQGRVTQDVEVIVEAASAEDAFAIAEKGNWGNLQEKGLVDWEFEEDTVEEDR